MTAIELGPGMTCDLARLIETRMIVQANSGGGKSWLLRRLLEQTHRHVQQVVIDPEGEFASLRERYDYIYAARHGGDTAADPRTAGLLAERLLELRVSAILDIYDLRSNERVRFVKSFLDALVNAPKALWHPVLIVLDEAHNYAPESGRKKGRGESESVGAVIDLMTLGRKRGFCGVLASGRMAKLHKDAAAEGLNKLIGRTGLDVDMKRAGDELGFSPGDRTQLRDLEDGEFFAYGPALTRTVTKFRSGSVETTHPKAGKRIAFTAPPPTAKVKALLPKLSDLPAEVEEREKSLADLKRELADTRRRLTLAERQAPEPTVERVEVPVLQPEHVRLIEELTAVNREARQAYEQASARYLEGARELTAALERARNGANAAQRFPRRRPSAQPVHAARPRQQHAEVVHAGDIGRSQQRILNALAWLESTVGLMEVDKVQVALMADQSPTRGGYKNNLGALRSAGLLHYPRPGMVGLTNAGRANADAGDIPTSTEDLHEHICARLSSSQASILRVLIDNYPQAVAKDDLALASQQSPTSGGYKNNLGRLRSLGLIEYPEPGMAVAQPVLFLEF